MQQIGDDLNNAPRAESFAYAKIAVGLASVNASALRSAMAGCACSFAVRGALNDLEHYSFAASLASNATRFAADRNLAVDAYNQIISAVGSGGCAGVGPA